jgi:hypothetical protein
LSKTGRTKTFFLATGIEAGAGVGTETEAEIGVVLAIETFGIVKIVGTEAGTIRIVETGAGAGTGVEIALGIEAFSCARLNKNSR